MGKRAHDERLRPRTIVPTTLSAPALSGTAGHQTVLLRTEAVGIRQVVISRIAGNGGPHFRGGRSRRVRAVGVGGDTARASATTQGTGRNRPDQKAPTHRDHIPRAEKNLTKTNTPIKL